MIVTSNINAYHWRRRSDGSERISDTHRPCMAGVARLIVKAINDAQQDADSRHSWLTKTDDGDHVYYVEIPAEKTGENSTTPGGVVKISFADDPSHPERLRLDWIER